MKKVQNTMKIDFDYYQERKRVFIQDLILGLIREIPTEDLINLFNITEEREENHYNPNGTIILKSKINYNEQS